MYNKKTWIDKEPITKNALNNMEEGIAYLDEKLSKITRSDVYFIHLEDWGIHNGFLDKREYIQNEDGSYKPKYTDEEYTIAHNNLIGLNAALKYAADNGFASATLPNQSEIFIAWEEDNKSVHAYWAYNLDHIIIPSHLDFNMNNSTIKVIFDSKNRNPYDLSIHDYENPIYRVQGCAVTFKGCQNSSIRNGTLIGTAPERAFIPDLDNESGKEQNHDMGTGIIIKDSSTFIKIENMKIKGFMADGISSSSSHDPSLGGSVWDPEFNNVCYIDTATGELKDSDGTSFCSDLLSIENWKCKEGIMRVNIGYTRVPKIYQETFELFWYDAEKKYLFNTRSRYLQSFIVPEQAKFLRVLIKREQLQDPGFKKTFQLTPNISEFTHINFCEICENRRGGISNVPNNTLIENNKIFNNGLGKYEGQPQFGDSTRYGINCEDCLPLNVTIRNNYFNDHFHAILFRGGLVTCQNNIFNEISGSSLQIYGCETAFFLNNVMYNSGQVGFTESNDYNKTFIMRDNIWIGKSLCRIPKVPKMVQNVSGVTINGYGEFSNTADKIIRDVDYNFDRPDNYSYIGGVCNASNCENVMCNINGRCVSTAKVILTSNKNTKNFIVRNVSATEECCAQFKDEICNTEMYDLGPVFVNHVSITEDNDIIRNVSNLKIENTYMRNVLMSNNFYNKQRPYKAEYVFKNNVIDFDDNHEGINNLSTFRDFIFPYQYAACEYESVIDIVFEDCIFNFDQVRAKNIFASHPNMYITGLIVFKNCHFNNNSGANIRLIDLNNMSREGAHIDLIIENCTFNGKVESTNPDYPFKGAIIKDGIELQPNDLL